MDNEKLKRSPADVVAREEYKQALLDLKRFTVEAACPEVREYEIVQDRLMEKFGRLLPRFFAPFSNLPKEFEVARDKGVFTFNRTVNGEEFYRVVVFEGDDQPVTGLRMSEDANNLVEQLGFHENDSGAYVVGQMQLVAYDLLMLTNRFS